MDIILLTLIFGSIILCYFYLTRNYHYWRDRNIPCIKTVIIPGFGHTWTILWSADITSYMKQIYDSFPDRSMVGFYNKTIPALVVREPKLIKTIILTNFANFSKNLIDINPDIDPLLAVNPFFCQGKKWSALRNTWTRMFSNAKLKILFARVEPICKKLEKYLDQKLSQNKGTMEIKMDDIITKYTTEVIANIGFGVKGFCFDDTSDTLPLDKISESTFGQNFRALLKEYIYYFLPELNRVLRISLFSRSLTNHLCNMIKLMQKNAQTGTILSLLLDQRKKDGEEYDENMLLCDAFTFFHSSYDSSRMTIIFVLYQLVQHPHIQQKLRDEVKTVLAKYDGCLTYEALKEMSYMDQVISESQRINTVVSTMVKICTKEFELNGSDGLSCRVQPGVQIFLSIDGLHKDSKYWPDPNVFDPDRFAIHRKVENEKFTFLPFGEGPRLCLGMKLGVMFVKSCLATIIGKYTLEISPKTDVPLKMCRKLIKVPYNVWFNIK